MSEWFYQTFSGGVSLSRANPVGIALIILSLVAIMTADPLSKRFKNLSGQMIKFAGLFLCAAGTAIAIL